MDVSETELPDVKIVTPRVHRDDRGFFFESYNRRALHEVAGINAEFVQDNHSCSDSVGVIRGLHFQTSPNAQAKLVRVLRGAIFDVAVDLRRGSPTFGRSVSMILDSHGHAQAWIPVGFAHGFCTLHPHTEVFYKVTAPYDPACDKGLAWDDPDLSIEWPTLAQNAILSEKDQRHPRLRDLPTYFEYCQAKPLSGT